MGTKSLKGELNGKVGSLMKKTFHNHDFIEQLCGIGGWKRNANGLVTSANGNHEKHIEEIIFLEELVMVKEALFRE